METAMRGVLKFGMLCVAAVLPAAAQAANVEVTLQGVREGGDLSVGLQTRDQFMGQAGTNKIIPAPAGTATVTLENVAPGDYAVVVWHDDNKNGKFDAGAAGGPPEDGWALSNFVNPTAPPTFDQVKIAVAEADVKVAMPMNYGR
jgi:uncharacterized protein (DUF2141 family)